MDFFDIDNKNINENKDIDENEKINELKNSLNNIIMQLKGENPMVENEPIGRDDLKGDVKNIVLEHIEKIHSHLTEEVKIDALCRMMEKRRMMHYGANQLDESMKELDNKKYTIDDYIPLENKKILVNKFHECVLLLSNKNESENDYYLLDTFTDEEKVTLKKWCEYNNDHEERKLWDVISELNNISCKKCQDYFNKKNTDEEFKQVMHNKLVEAADNGISRIDEIIKGNKNNLENKDILIELLSIFNNDSDVNSIDFVKFSIDLGYVLSRLENIYKLDKDIFESSLYEYNNMASMMEKCTIC